VDVKIKLDVLGPIIVISKPDNNSLYGKMAPNAANFTMSFTGGSGISGRWYMMYNGSYTSGNHTWNGFIDQNVWERFGNGMIILRIYANDSLGNIWYSELSLRKDTSFSEELKDEQDKKTGDNDTEPKQDIISFLTSPLGIITLISIVGGLITVIAIIKRNRNPYEYS